MAKKRRKKARELTTEEALKRLFPKDIRQMLKRLALNSTAVRKPKKANPRD